MRWPLRRVITAVSGTSVTLPNAEIGVPTPSPTVAERRSVMPDRRDMGAITVTGNSSVPSSTDPALTPSSSALRSAAMSVKRLPARAEAASSACRRMVGAPSSSEATV